MKKSTKNLAASFIIGGLLIAPVFCSAHIGDDKAEKKSKTEISTKNVDYSQAEIESIEELRKITKPGSKKIRQHRNQTNQMIALIVICEIENFARPILPSRAEY